MMQAVIHFTGNPIVTKVSPVIFILSPLVFLVVFIAAAFWTHRPIRLASQEKNDHALERAMASLPLRAVKGFGIGGFIYVIYVLIILAISSMVAEHPLTPRMMVAINLSVSFGLGILIPTLAVALTMAWMARVRKKLSLQKLFIGNLEQFHSYPWLIRSSNRPWLIFGVTSLIPATLLGAFTLLMLGTTNQEEQQFILMQSIVLFSNLVIGGTALIWVTSKSVHRITRELALGLSFLREGKFDGHVAVMVDDDMGDLARGLNTALHGLKERDNLKDSLAIASEIQRGLMPREEPNIEGYMITGFQRSCYSVGGDYYDYIQRGNDTTWLVIADVSGKGYPAALTVANLQAMLHALANSENISLLDGITYINHALHKSLQSGRFVTLFMAELNLQTNSLEWVNAGHPPPLLWQDNTVSRLEATAPPLGVLDTLNLYTEHVLLASGNALFACTDGITEARNATAEMFTDKRVETWFKKRHNLDPSVMPSSMLTHLSEQGFHSYEDDITMLCLKRRNHDNHQA